MALLIALSVFTCAIPTAGAAAAYDTDGDGTLEILSVGNSFSADSMTMVYSIATDLGIENVNIAYLYYSGAALENHVNFTKNKSTSYTYYYCNASTGGEWKSKSNQTIDYGLTAQSWDYIMIQETSARSGILSYYEKDLGNLVDYIKNTVTNSPKLIWNMTWAYQQNYDNSVFESNYSGDQMTMYNAILNAVSKAVVTNDDIDLIIPIGTSIQNARTAWYGDTITRDGYHLTYSFGRYVAALTVVKAITGLDVSGCKARPNDDLNNFYHDLAVEAVNNAIETPFAVTDSIYGKDDYVKITPQVTIGKYWSSTNAEGNHNNLFTSNKYACFEKFTEDEVPAGSIIWLKNGWKYRPIGWNGTERAESTLPWVTDSGYLITTADFWNNYTTRSVNIVHPYYYSTYGTNQVLGDADIKSLQNNSIVVIYVPKSAHVHRLVDNVCTLCGYECLDHIHDYSATETKSATCTEEGIMTYICACGDKYTEAIEALNHKDTLVKVEGKAATCNEAGYEAYEYCTACEYTTFEAIDALNHKGTLVQVEGKEPTATEPGYEAYEYCTACDYTTFKANDNYIAKIGEKGYATIREAFAVAKDGDIITLVSDVTLENSDVEITEHDMYAFVSVTDKKVTFDFNGKTITANPSLDKNMLAVFYVTGTGNLTLVDSSEDKTGALNVTMANGTKAYSLLTADGDKSKLTIKSGNYYIDKVLAGYSMVYVAQTGTGFVNGGNFVLGNAYSYEKQGAMVPWIFNTYGNGKNIVEVKGGTYNVNPQNRWNEVKFPKGYVAYEDVDGIWKVARGPIVVEQPTDITIGYNKMIHITPVIAGDNLTYKWYYSDNDGKYFYTSTLTTATYDVRALPARDGRQVYCVATDRTGKSVITDVVTLNVVPNEELAIVKQPTVVEGTLNKKVTVDLDVTGDALTYVWYYSDNGGKYFYKSTLTTETYDIVLKEERNGRVVYCVITDAFGKTIKSDYITINAVQSV